MLNQMMKPHNLYSITEVQNTDTYEMEKSKTPVKSINVAISDAGYQQYLNNDMSLQQYSFVGFTDSADVVKGMFVDDMEVVHVLPMGLQYVLYLKAVE